MRLFNRWRIQRLSFVALCALGIVALSATKTISAESTDQKNPLTAESSLVTNLASDSAVGLSSLVNEALLRSPIIAAAKAHWQASTKVPRQVSTIPDPQISFQQLP